MEPFLSEYNFRKTNLVLAAHHEQLFLFFLFSVFYYLTPMQWTPCAEQASMYLTYFPSATHIPRGLGCQENPMMPYISSPTFSSQSWTSFIVISVVTLHPDWGLNSRGVDREPFRVVSLLSKDDVNLANNTNEWVRDAEICTNQLFSFHQIREALYFAIFWDSRPLTILTSAAVSHFNLVLRSSKYD